jgi:hypothetical protein
MSFLLYPSKIKHQQMRAGKVNESFSRVYFYFSVTDDEKRSRLGALREKKYYQQTAFMAHS